MLNRWQNKSLQDEGQKVPMTVMVGGKKALLHTQQSLSQLQCLGSFRQENSDLEGKVTKDIWAPRL